MHQTEGKTCGVKSDDLKKTQCVKEKTKFHGCCHGYWAKVMRLWAV